MDVSIIVPVYNSSANLNKLSKEIRSNVKKQLNYEILLVNDFSVDDSWNIIKHLSKKNRNIRGINLKKNYGQHTAIFVGLKYARGKKIITMDDDLQHPPKSLNNIIDALNSYDLCYTLYIKRKHLIWKKTVSYINNIFSSFLFNKSYKIYLSSFRGFRSKLLPSMLKNQKKVIFIDSLLLNSTKKITTIKVKHKKRYQGESTYNVKNLFSLWFDMIENYHFFPIRFGSFIGIISYLIVKLLRFNFKKFDKKIEIKQKTFR